MSSSQRALSILLVEDSPMDSRLLHEALRPAAASGEVIVQTVKRLGQAVDELKINTFSCVLLDLGLPDGQGVDNVSALRQVDRQSAIVVLTGLDDETIASEALKLGAQDYLVKGSADGDSLMRIVRRAVQRNRQVAAIETKRDQAFFEASHDALTLLPNAALFLDRGRQALAAAHAQQQVFPLAVIVLDGLAALRERQGSPVTDEQLRQLALQLAEALPPAATLGRLDADSFGLFGLAPAALEAQIARVAARLGQGDRESALALRRGLVEAEPDESFESLLGRASVAVSAPETVSNAEAGRPTSLVDGGETTDHWQPWMDLRSGQYAGVEFLPGEGLNPLLEVLLRQAVRLGEQWRQWSAARFEPAMLAFHVSPAVLADAAQVSALVEQLRGGVPPARLQLHVGESAFRDLAQHGEGLSTLRARGYRVVLEGDGSNGITLADFAAYPVDAFRISSRFVHRFLEEGLHGRSRRMLTALLGAADALGAKVMAAGVDSEQAVSTLRLLGLHFVQGRAVAPESTSNALPILWERGTQRP